AVLHAAAHLQINITIAAAVTGDQLLADAMPLSVCVRVIQADLTQAAGQAVELLPEKKHSPAEHRQHFVNAVAEQETPVERRDSSIAQRQILAVEVALRQRLGHGAISASRASYRPPGGRRNRLRTLPWSD